MPNKVCFISIDVEENIDNFSPILETIEKHRIRSTLFVVGTLLAREASFFKELAHNHEIACHSFSHRFWNTLDGPEREKELDDFISFYRDIFNEKPKGFRAPSHIIDKEGFQLLEEKGFLYDSSIVPHYPPFKKYRGYRGKFPSIPYYHPEFSKLLEIPVSGQLLGIPLAGAWISKLPFWVYRILFFLYCPSFITLSIHSWDSLENLDKILNLLKKKNYQFFNGQQVHQNYR